MIILQAIQCKLNLAIAVKRMDSTRIPHVSSHICSITTRIPHYNLSQYLAKFIEKEYSSPKLFMIKKID
ncbi:MAG: hypothetical protein PUP93_19130 [Rhizonema sp. NSF051]|nr:hypothetical protein [Rhizonema sp. NSF051]